MPFLNELASIHSGYSLRNPYAEFQRPNVGWITPSHIIAQNFNQLPEIEVKLVKNITVLKPGDVLLTNRVQFKIVELLAARHGKACSRLGGY